MRVWTKEEIKTLIESNDKMVCVSLKQLYNKQTEDERIDKQTSNRNGVGFNGVDAPILSSFAEFYISHGYLSQKQIAIARKKLTKYSKQLTELANNG